MRQDYQERAKIHSAGRRGKSVSARLHAVKNIPKIRGLWKRVALNGLYHWAGPDWAPIVEDQENKWVIREGMHRMRGLTR